MRFSPIAVVGRGCLLPGANNPDELFRAVAEGRDLTSSAPADRWRVDPATIMTSSPASARDKAWSDRGGYVEGFEQIFDPSGFALAAEDVLALDPLFQWVLHTGRQALREAGRGEPIADKIRRRAGIVLGNLSFPTDALNRLFESHHLGPDGEALVGERPDVRNRFSSGLPSALLGRALGLGGPAFSIDAACASSLYAIKLACDRLHDGSADLMLAGAVNRTDDLFIHVGFCALQALSKTGRSRPFHQEADGLLPAEGAAFVALKRLEDAIADGDHIFGVIRGVGLSNDGRAAGLLSPSQEGQKRALRSAYAQAGLSPSDVSLLECHATGTAVGDGAEIGSMGELYAGLSGVPIGSLKSNMGHLITVAGCAGLLKVMGAMEAGIRPPTLHAAEAPLAAIASSPFRLLNQAEPWDVASGPRRAAVSAFGFGGNNAHLIVEQYEPSLWPKPVVARPAPAPVAVVACSVLAADGNGVTDFARALFEGETQLRVRDGNVPAAATTKVDVALKGLRFPPKDLEQTLSQQLLILRAAQLATADAGPLSPERTSVLVGMGCDAEIARYGARWRLPTWAASLAAQGINVPAGWLEAAQSAFAPSLDAAGVLGTMPNIPANRLNSQLDLGGPSFTVSAEELSGVSALQIAARALREGEIDAALVGAVDMSVEPVHEASLEAVTGRKAPPGDAAVVLVLKRLEDARQDGSRVLCVLDEIDSGSGLLGVADGDVRIGDGGLELTPLFGHAHAASGLLHVAAGALALEHRVLPAASADGEPAPLLPSRELRSVSVRISSFSGQRGAIRLVEDRTEAPTPLLRTLPPRIFVFSGESSREVLAAASSGQQSDAGPARLCIVAATDEEFAERLAWATRRLSAEPDTLSLSGDNVVYRASPMGGELAFVFGGPASVYGGMGRDLMLAFPHLIEELSDRFARMRDVAGWLYNGSDAQARSPVEKLWASSFLCQGHARLTRGLLGLRPHAAIGVSSGETNALFALGAWENLDAMFEDIDRSGLYDRELGGAFDAARRAWGMAEGEPVPWVCYRVLAPVAQIRAAIADEPRAHLTIIHAEGDCVIGGERAACERALARIGRERARELGYDLVVHCPEAEAWSDGWRTLHRRPTRPVPGVRYYGHATCAAYEVSDDNTADALTGQLLHTVDFPKLIEQAYADGVRVFLEHGPQGACSRWIERTLGDRDHVTISLDAYGENSVERIAFAIATLTAAGVPVERHAFEQALASAWKPKPTSPSPSLSFPAHQPPPAVVFPAQQARPVSAPVAPAPAPTAAAPAQPALSPPSSALSGTPQAAMMPPAPRLPRVLDEPLALDRPTTTELSAQPQPPPPAPIPAAALAEPQPTPVAAPPVTQQPAYAAPAPAYFPAPAPIADSANPLLGRLVAYHAQLAALHRTYIEQQSQLHERFLQLRNITLPAAALAPAAFAAEPAPAAFAPPAQPTYAQPAYVQPPVAAPQPAPSPQPTYAPPAPAVEARPATSSVVEKLAPLPYAPKPQASAPKAAAPAAAPPARRATGPQAPPAFLPPLDPATLPGPKLDRQQLEQLASGKISSVLGPVFARQDDFRRQVRMPMPPLLLADRVTGITGEPGVVGKGTIWTETDVAWDAFYLHHGYMQPGVMIESGQADLLLISWMGADFVNRGDRIYRLLGCELTYHDELPRPGETLQYDIHIDGHAQHDNIRLFFFHYDCRVEGNLRLSVRHGQAGFFTDEELLDSGGVLWDAATGDHAEKPRLAEPLVAQVPKTLSIEQLRKFSEGDTAGCFGPTHDAAQAHVRSPSIATGNMMLLGDVTELDVKGGPWGRGYLRSERKITPDDWFFEGHFKDDPCMPGTLMFEGAMQTMAVYLAALGFTLDRDGHRFAPVTGEPYKLLCRGQVTPKARELVYELFVDELVEGPEPTLYADLLCTVDGLKAFHCRRMGFRITPDWPMNAMKEAFELPVHDPNVAQHDGHSFGLRSLIACAWGKPSEAFGPMYKVFDGQRRTPRLPGPPYHFMSRIMKIDGGTVGKLAAGIQAEVEYDVPKDAWYFDENGAPTMPYCVLLEAALQPCGWLASATGATLTTEQDLRFRNLDGSATWFREITPETGVLTTRTKLTNVSRSAGMIIVSFEVACEAGGERIYDMKTVFGFFPKEALDSQVGLSRSDEERAYLEKPCDYRVELSSSFPERFFGGTARLGTDKALMLDRLTGYWPDAGAKGLGRLRAEKDVSPDQWFFKAHFFQDAVQPGSLGIEAMIQALQALMIEKGMGEGIDNPRFEPLAMGHTLSWKYRGQVVPRNKRVTVEIELTDVVRDEKGVLAIADSHLWVDGLCIYSAKGLGMRMVPGGTPPSTPPTPRGSKSGSAEQLLTLSSAPYLADHRPTYTVPAMPAMAMADELARGAAEAFPGEKVIGLRDVQVKRWVPVGEQGVRLKLEIGERTGDEVPVSLLIFREARSSALSRFEPAATGTVILGAAYNAPPAALPILEGATPAENPYDSGALFHGPSLKLLESLQLGSSGSSALLDVAHSTAPKGHLGMALLDAATHAIPHDELWRWSSEIPASQVGYPSRITRASFHGESPRGKVRVEVRFAGLEGERFPAFDLQIIDGDRVWAELHLVEILFDKGPLGEAPRLARRAFLQGIATPEVGLSVHEGLETRLDPAAVRGSDWLPGTMAATYATSSEGEAQFAEIAIKEHTAAQTGLHPRLVTIDGNVAGSAHLPLNRLPFALSAEGGQQVVKSGPIELDLAAMQSFWQPKLGARDWIIEDLYFALLRRFTGRIFVADPAAIRALEGKPVVFLANHQVAAESLLFSVAISSLIKGVVVTVAKAEHRHTWVGKLIKQSFTYPGVTDPDNIVFFDREDKDSLIGIAQGLLTDLRERQKSVLVHVEGTRSMECRTPVAKSSSIWADLAIGAGAPIIPVHLGGALPLEGTERLEFPVGYGKQDFYLGKPIFPEQLMAMPLPERRRAIVDGINAAGVRPEVEQPAPPATDFIARVEARRAAGANEVQAVLNEVLAEVPSPSEGTRKLLEALAHGPGTLANDAEGAWMRGLLDLLAAGALSPLVSVRAAPPRPSLLLRRSPCCACLPPAHMGFLHTSREQHATAQAHAWVHRPSKEGCIHKRADGLVMPSATHVGRRSFALLARRTRVSPNVKRTVQRQ